MHDEHDSNARPGEASGGEDVRRDVYPNYDVLSKRDTPSWNAQTRAVIEERLGLDPNGQKFFSKAEWDTLVALCDRIVPQPADRPGRIPIAAMVDDKMHRGEGDGYRVPELPLMGDAWRLGLKALDAEAEAALGQRFYEAPPSEQDKLLKQMEKGELKGEAWAGMPSKTFFEQRVLSDVVRAYYAHPTAWNEIGWGGPAGPRGYVRLNIDRRDPWEAAEAKPGHEEEARQANLRVGR